MSTSKAAVKTLRMGIIGLGQGAAGIMPTMDALDEIDLVAATVRNPQVRDAFLARHPGARAYPDVEGLCADPNVDAVWIATPNRLHAEHAIQAMRAGKHVAVDKPMAVTMAEADAMLETAEKYGVKLLAGHTDSLTLSVRAMRKIALSGVVGAPRAIFNWSYTDWMLRPRTPAELAPESGFGIVHRQAPHQIDTVRLLGGGLLRSVRGSVGAWMPERPVPGFYTAFFEFENGMPANIIYNGYGYFMTLELYPEAADRHRYTDEDRVAIRRTMQAGTRNDEVDKRDFQVGGRRDPTVKPESADTKPWSPMDLGMVVLSCERGDLRHGQYGVLIYGDDGKREVDLRKLRQGELDLEGGGALQALLELYGAVIEGKPLFHDGAWGRATLEATIAIAESARTGKEVRLQHQVAMPLAYDADLELEL
jgi:phthalate 4,5-cis-dihydrodiol dehydrogenase